MTITRFAELTLMEVTPFTRRGQDTYAVIWRRDDALSPATSELIAVARQLLAGHGRALLSD